MAEIKLQFVNKFDDARGQLRYVFRRRGHKKVTLRGAAGGEEFMAQYHALLEQTGGAPVQPGIRIGGKPGAGTVDQVVIDYLASDAFLKGLADTSQAARRNVLENFRDTLTKKGRRYGSNQFASLRRVHILRALEGKTPSAKLNWLKSLRHLMAWAVEQEKIGGDPCEGIKVKRPKTQGHMTWLEPQVEQYRKQHALGTMARLALELLLNIAARRYDAHVIGAPHIQISNKDGKKRLCWRPHKTLRSTGKMLKIRILPNLQEALEAMPIDRDALTFLRNDYGRPFASAAAFGNKFADWCVEAGFEPVRCDDGRTRNYRAHGLRKAALRTAAHAKCTLHELMALSGHSSPDELQTYLEEIEQEFMADSALDKVLAAAEDVAKTANVE